MLYSYCCNSFVIKKHLTAAVRLQCQKLTKEFQNYVAECGLLRKVFISVKGIYYQARIRKKYDVTWIVPHQFNYTAPKIDFSTMCTFLDFYLVLLKFVNFRLYLKSNMSYPPFGGYSNNFLCVCNFLRHKQIEVDYDLTCMSLTKLRRKGHTIYGSKSKANNKADAAMNIDDKKDNQKAIAVDVSQIVSNIGPEVEKIEEEPLNSDEDIVTKENEKQQQQQKKQQERGPSRLFQGFHFLLNRETPQFSLEFVILSMGGKATFEQDCTTQSQRNATNITHQVVDRPIAEDSKLKTREYIQPQWVYDCLNAGCVVPVEHYQPGVQCPPHLSPFVNYDEHHHKPSQAFVIEHWQELAKEYNGVVRLPKTSGKSNVQRQNTASDPNPEPEQQKTEDVNPNDDNEYKTNNETGFDLTDWIDEGIEMQEKETAKKDADVPHFDISTTTQKSEEETLTQQRLEIAEQRRKLEQSGVQKNIHEHIQILKFTKAEAEREMLAKTFMSGRAKKFYNTTVRKQQKTTNFWNAIEKKRARLEQKKS
ncbi:hypothetical protein RFI_09208 [Reticulomyxa filosa]|uniref:BRCT domain-containing protein n=1 Tax=Reticulomyxa filosa TaxID=46433 RepID=X6NNU0_RETFI|nr:hypothetical protein RFI_09208 [Reticulomyxa filosa]|eukprot:ETO27925.1 hypothetical protein RFI_09208 [Reticulomyxa filosa]